MTNEPPPRRLLHPGWRPHVRTGLEDLIAQGPGVAAFDCDATLLTGDISETALADLAADTGAPLVARYEEEMREDLLGAYVGLVHTLMAGKSREEAHALARSTLRRHPELRLRAGFRELVWNLHVHGWDVWVVSASAEPLVQVAVEGLGILPNRVIGMRSRLDAHGRFAPELAIPPTWHEGKVTALDAVLDRPLILAAGDSRGDLPMLQASRRSLLVDLGSEAVRAEAERLGAWIQPGHEVTESEMSSETPGRTP